ncbi:hypothetical protein D9757_007574 [Collybiopsis confluens]|uniref:Chromo domain-containing protein n=1 Tax=Collybiopsis confluens TaxID=2823264 RepID=A0A8H5HE91_9AGAR|nr:hypothetical protein D9757_007574 [Collybiopsis confluens]
MPPARTPNVQSVKLCASSPEEQLVSATRKHGRVSLMEDAHWPLAHSSSPLRDLKDSDARPTKKTRRSDAHEKSPSSRDGSELPEPITIRGHQLYPTVVWDTFWRWCHERKAIDDRRRAGQPFPWTEDEILCNQFFCNTFRVLDKTCQFIIRQVIETGDQSPTEVVFRVLLFDVFTKIDTWNWLLSEIGVPTWKEYKRETYFRALERRVRTHSLYTGAFQKPSPRWDFKEGWRNHLLLVETMMEADLVGHLQAARSMSEAFAFIVEFPGMGHFNSFQLLQNLSYSPVINFSGKDFVVPGIGCISGLSKMFGSRIDDIAKTDTSFRLVVIRYMMETQDKHFRRLGLDFSGLGPKRLPMELADIEHAICEVDKYSRLAHPEISGRNGRRELRRNWSRPTEPSLPSVVLPRAWSHRKRKKVRPCNDLPKTEVRYLVAKILGHREDEHGEIFCHTRWVNYGPQDDTWEPATVLLQDAPVIVNEYWNVTFGSRHPNCL